MLSVLQKFISSAFSEPFNTAQGLLDATMTGRTSDVVESQSGVDPLWIVLPLCIAIIAVLLFVVVVIVFRFVTFVSCILGANYKKILRLSYDVIITYDNRKSNLR